MRRLASIAALSCALAISTDTVAQGPSQPKLVCDRGPVTTKSFGGTQWQLYGCNDNRSVAIVTAPGSPAIPFYFLLAWVNCIYTVIGDSTGRGDLTAKAHNDLVELTQPHVDALVR